MWPSIGKNSPSIQIICGTEKCEGRQVFCEVVLDWAIFKKDRSQSLWKLHITSMERTGFYRNFINRCLINCPIMRDIRPIKKWSGWSWDRSLSLLWTGWTRYPPIIPQHRYVILNVITTFCRIPKDSRTTSLPYDDLCPCPGHLPNMCFQPP